jgi:hypothetical protein
LKTGTYAEPRLLTMHIQQVVGSTHH